ncbi:MAG: histone deacetylase family protein [Spirochaetales bacterium]|nr:histone deacetylase family protein [Spirochaetales bacterium]
MPDKNEETDVSMFRIRRIYDDILPVNKHTLTQVAAILRDRFPAISDYEVSSLADHLKNPMKYRYRSILFVSDDMMGRVKGFALLNHYPDLNFIYLDYVSTSKTVARRGIGGALYERVREEALTLKVLGIFFECLPDDPELCKDPELLKQNRMRLKFYERYGAFPIANTTYETPLTPDDDNPPYLVFDGLGKHPVLHRDLVKLIVTAILERKYSGICPPDYIDAVLSSFKDEPVQLRKPLYIKEEHPVTVAVTIPQDKKIVLVINDKHDIHHVRERGYVEVPVRIRRIAQKCLTSNLFRKIPVKHFSERHITAIHEARFVHYLRDVSKHLKAGESVYPYIFPIRNKRHLPKDLIYRAGYYCIDTFTPINAHAYIAAKRAVDCALTAADELCRGDRIAYALVRPPGHHAERNTCGGFCYFNSAAAAAHFLSRLGKVAMLDIDYHHGNGQQDIFYERNDVLTISIHGHPSFSYPFFSGFEDETGKGAGEGFNINMPLPEHINSGLYIDCIKRAVEKISRFDPSFLIVLLGLDISRGDPVGTWEIVQEDFEVIGEMIGSLDIPTLVVQEGGYNTRHLGANAMGFFKGLWHGIYPS